MHTHTCAHTHTCTRTHRRRLTHTHTEEGIHTHREEGLHTHTCTNTQPSSVQCFVVLVVQFKSISHIQIKTCKITIKLTERYYYALPWLGQCHTCLWARNTPGCSDQDWWDAVIWPWWSSSSSLSSALFWVSACRSASGVKPVHGMMGEHFVPVWRCSLAVWS